MRSGRTSSLSSRRSTESSTHPSDGSIRLTRQQSSSNSEHPPRFVGDGLDFRRPVTSTVQNDPDPAAGHHIVDLTGSSPSPLLSSTAEQRPTAAPTRPPRLEARVRTLRDLRSHNSRSGGSGPAVIDLEAVPSPPLRPVGSHPFNHPTSDYVNASAQADFPERVDDLEIVDWLTIETPPQLQQPQQPTSTGIGAGPFARFLRATGLTRGANTTEAVEERPQSRTRTRPRRTIAEVLIARQQARARAPAGSGRDVSRRVQQHLTNGPRTLPPLEPAPPNFPANLFNYEAAAFGTGGELDFDLDVYDQSVDDLAACNATRPLEGILPPVTPANEGFTSDLNTESEIVCPNCNNELGTGDGPGQDRVFVAKICGHVSSTSVIQADRFYGFWILITAWPKIRGSDANAREPGLLWNLRNAQEPSRLKHKKGQG